MSIVTKTGDDGETGLADGSRLPKSDSRFHAVGTVDELNAVIGEVLAEDNAMPERQHLERLQHLLFRLGADLSMPLDGKVATKRIEEGHIQEIETRISEIEAEIIPLSQFILPGGTLAASRLHVARTVCRRAERWAVTLSEFEPVSKRALTFLNRVGDYLFLAARRTNRAAGAAEVQTTY